MWGYTYYSLPPDKITDNMVFSYFDEPDNLAIVRYGESRQKARQLSKPSNKHYGKKVHRPMHERGKV